MEQDEYGGGATEGDIRGNSSDLFEDAGIVDLLGGHLLVHEAASPDMTVIVDAGIGYIPNDSFDETDSDSIRFWEAVVAGNTASRTLSISSNSSGQTRIDLACLMLNPATTPDNEASNIADLIIVEGTPGAGAPALPSYHLLLATITVLNGATTIPNAKIADGREQVVIRRQFNKKRVVSTASSTTPTPNANITDEYIITALAGNATFGEPTGTPKNGQTLIVRVKDDGTARTLAFNSIYRFSAELPAPTTTTLSKTLYIGFMYNEEAVKWDCLAVLDNF